MIEFRDYQKNIISQGTEILKDKGFLYLAMEVRTGKTLTSLGIADQMDVEHVLFLTKKKAISSIVGDYDLMCPASFILFTINYESMHKLPQNIKWDIVIIDEAHSLGAIPKPNKRARDVKALIKKNKSKVILMSGTPTPESYSQMYHQVYGIPNNPFREYVSFYKFAKDYVDVRQRKINSMMINDYSRGLETIVDKMNPYTIRFTQKEAGFENDIIEEVLEVDMSELTYSLTSKLKKDLVVEGNEDVILADTPVKLMMKLHQMYSGTVKFESGNSMILDLNKAQFIYDNFCVSKVGIFYKFKEELNALKTVYGDQLCTELDEFNSTDKTIALQIVSGREGISLRNAEFLVYYNIDFSATSYWQSRDRMTTKDSKLSKVYWVFAKDGIEKQIYKSVIQKKDYTLKHFKRDLLTLN
jgi:SNF2 family DNA or RNA helicase